MSDEPREINNTVETLDEQLVRQERLRTKLLRRLEDMLDDKYPCTSTDIATITRFLSQQGWTLNPAQVPKKVTELLKDSPIFEDDDEGKVIEMSKRRKA